MALLFVISYYPGLLSGSSHSVLATCSRALNMEGRKDLQLSQSQSINLSVFLFSLFPRLLQILLLFSGNTNSSPYPWCVTIYLSFTFSLRCQFLQGSSVTLPEGSGMSFRFYIRPLVGIHSIHHCVGPRVSPHTWFAVLLAGKAAGYLHSPGWAQHIRYLQSRVHK